MDALVGRHVPRQGIDRSTGGTLPLYWSRHSKQEQKLEKMSHGWNELGQFQISKNFEGLISEKASSKKNGTRLRWRGGE